MNHMRTFPIKGFVTFSVTFVTSCNVIEVTKKSFIFNKLSLVLRVVTDVTSILRYDFIYSQI